MNFKSRADVLEDENFQSFVKKEINGAIESFAKRLKPKPGMKYKRNWYDRITDNYNFTFDFFMENIDKVLLKESNLNSEARTILTSIYMNALMKTISHYKKTETVTDEN